VINNNRVVLNYGSFTCTADYAVKEAFILSTAFDALQRDLSARIEIGEILSEYIAGISSFEETIAALNEDLDPE